MRLMDGGFIQIVRASCMRTAESAHVSCTEDAMAEQSQLRDGLEITSRYRSFDSNHAPHVREMRNPVALLQTRRRAAKCCHPPVTSANFRACCREGGAEGPRSATSACQSAMLGAAEARHVATGRWSILPSRCDGRLQGQRLCVPVNGRGQT